MVEILTLGGARADPGAASIAKLRGSLRGGLVLAGDAAYETARRVWNGNVDRRPALIARCADPADVQHAVASPAPTACCFRCAAAGTARRATAPTTAAW